MQNPVFDRQHIREYFVYGSIAAVLYMIPVWFFLADAEYKNLYYLFIGIALFMLTILCYAYKLVYRPYERKRSVAMLTAGHLATISGIAIALLLVLISVLIFFPHLSIPLPADSILKGAPATLQPHRPSGLLFMLLAVTAIGNAGVGSFISVATSYAGRRGRSEK
ncbi:MAG: hypothetical protein ABJA78_06545 [Ferruginibacter sp.]